MAERKLTVSTDSLGILGRPNEWMAVWDFLQKASNFSGFEVIGWDFPFLCSIEDTIKKASVEGVRVAGIHGRTGGIHDADAILERARLAAINALLIKTSKLADVSTQVDYVLIHTPVLHNQADMNAILSLAGKKVEVFIENHIKIGSLGAAFDTVSFLRSQGVNASVMLDLFHRVQSLDGRETLTGTRTWEIVIGALLYLANQKDMSGKPLSFGLHIPLGTNLSDSLDFDKITGSMWSELGCLLNETPACKRIVIENQQLGIGVLGTTKHSREIQKERNLHIYEALNINGVV